MGLYKPEPIRNIDQQLTRTTRAMVLIVVILLPVLIISHGHPLILGLIVGGVFGILNGFFLVRRMNMLVDLLKERDVDQKKAKAFMRGGFYPRIGMVVGIIFLASQVDFISVYGVGAGLLVPTAITVMDANVVLYRYYTARNAVDKI